MIRGMQSVDAAERDSVSNKAACTCLDGKGRRRTDAREIGSLRKSVRRGLRLFSVVFLTACCGRSLLWTG